MINHYDLIVIGGGSGGIATARRASEYGAKCAVIENNKLGGTCVNVGCVPKKVMWTTSRIAEILQDAPDYGFSVQYNGFDWSTIKQSRDAYIARLNDIYANNLDKASVETVDGTARLMSRDSVQVGETIIKAEHILIATGGRPLVPDIPGADLGITSDGFFEIENLPAKVVITGAGYIATELAGMLHGLGSEVIMVLRKDKLLRGFDSSITEVVMSEMQRSGIKFVLNAGITSLQQRNNNKAAVHLADGQTIDNVDKFIFAIGRIPNTQHLNLEAASVQVNAPRVY